MSKMPGVQHVISIIGYSLLDSVAESNSAFVVAKLAPFADRTKASESVQALIGRTFGVGQRIRSATVFPFNLPPIIGLSTSGGFEYQLEALEGQDPAAIGSVMQGLVAAANQDPRLARVFSTFTAQNPSIYLDIDRTKAQALGVPLSSVFDTLQATLGGFFVNNFNLYGRTWQVNIEGRSADRRDISALWNIYVRSATGQMVPLRALADARIVVGPQVLTRYNNYRSVTLNGAPAPGVSSGTALAAMAAVSAQYAAARLGLRMDRHRLSGAGRLRPDRCHPRPLGAVRLPVPGGAVRELGDPDPGPALGHRRRVRRVLRHPGGTPLARPLRRDRARGADRARRQERHPDRGVRQGPARRPAMPIREAAALGARMRFRAVMMTSVAFILGLVPLVWATGAAQISRRDVGTSVFAGMIFASAIGIFLIPMLYVTFQTMRERTHARWRRKRPHPAE